MAEDGITTTSIETTTENSINSTTDPMDSIILDDETLENFFTYIYENTLGYDYEEDDDDNDYDDDNYDDDSSEHPINQTTPSANTYFTNDTIEFFTLTDEKIDEIAEKLAKDEPIPMEFKESENEECTIISF